MQPAASDTPYHPKNSKRLMIILLFVALGMFGFGYLLVPFYNVMCEQLGINGKTNSAPAAAVTSIDPTRTITVQFLATNNANLPWQFHPNQTTIQTHPGQNTHISFYAKNESNKTMVVQAIPSVAPGEAARYLKKTECFCFKQQTLKSGASMNMPVVFHLDRDLPKDINTVTLSYTLFDNTNMKRRDPPAEIEGHIK